MGKIMRSEGLCLMSSSSLQVAPLGWSVPANGTALSCACSSGLAHKCWEEVCDKWLNKHTVTHRVPPQRTSMGFIQSPRKCIPGPFPPQILQNGTFIACRVGLLACCNHTTKKDVTSACYLSVRDHFRKPRNDITGRCSFCLRRQSAPETGTQAVPKYLHLLPPWGPQLAGKKGSCSPRPLLGWGFLQISSADVPISAH